MEPIGLDVILDLIAEAEKRDALFLIVRNKNPFRLGDIKGKREAEFSGMLFAEIQKVWLTFGNLRRVYPPGTMRQGSGCKTPL